MSQVAYVVHVRTPGKIGGETRSYQVAAALSNVGLKVHLYGNVEANANWQEIIPHQLELPYPRGVFQLIRDLKHNDVKVVIERYQFPLFNVGVLAQRIRRKPLILEIHGFPIDEYMLLAKDPYTALPLGIRLITAVPTLIWSALQKLIFSSVQGFIVTSSGTKNILVSMGVPEQNVRVIYNAVDPQRFDPALYQRDKARASFGFQEDERIVLYAGTLFQEEMDCIIKAASKIITHEPKVKFIRVGAEPAETLQAKVAAEGIEARYFEFSAPIPHECMPALLAAADVVLAPYSLGSSRFKSGFHYSPLKIMEALAMNKTIVTVDADELRNMFGTLPTVYFAQSGDVDSWGHEISAALAQPPIQDVGRQFILNGHRWIDVAGEYKQIVDDMMSK